MDLHVVQPGETIYSIADSYGVSADKLIRDNNIKMPDHLLIGQTIVITYPSKTYLVQEGDSLETIANQFDITVNELLRNNPFLVHREYIYPGEELVISYNRTASIKTHGFANAFINLTTLRKTLPFLTYLTLFNYRSSRNGDVVPSSDDTEILEMSKAYGVIPLMLMTTISTRGEVDWDITNEVLENLEVQNRLFDNVLRIVKERGYSGVNISAQFITTENQEVFINYIKNISERLRQEGYLTIITINPRVERENNEVTFENLDYSRIGSEVDEALFLQYKWGYNYDPPSPVISVANMQVFVDYLKSNIDKEKINLSIPALGYDWQLPYEPGISRANALTIESTKSLAHEVEAEIIFDELSQTPYFRYQSLVNGRLHEVWYINAVTIDSMLKMLLDKGIDSIGVWNIMVYYAQLWLVINSQYNIEKLLPDI